MSISREQALDCFRSDDLVGIGMEADAVRRRLHPEGVVTYVVEGRIECPGEAAGVERAGDAAAKMVDAGATGLRLGRGASCTGIDCWERMLGAMRRRFGSVWLEGPSAAEIAGIAKSAGFDLRTSLSRLQAAGMDSISGTGAAGGEWTEVHRAAHGLGMPTIAELEFGGGETLEQRVDRLDTIRCLQEETGGFAAFFPVPAAAPGGRDLDGVTAVERLKTLAVSRMFLDNIENIQASAAGEGLKVLQMGLRFGGNDVGAVSLASGGVVEEDIRRIIRDAGFRPAQRDMAYRAMMLS